MTDEDEIRRTIARYVQGYHSYDVAAFTGLFTQDGVFITRTPNDEYRGQAALKEFAVNRQRRQQASPNKRVKLMCGIPLITVRGDTAEALTDFVVFGLNGESPWYVKMSDAVEHLVGQWYISIVGLYADRLARQGEQWLFTERRIIAGES